MPVINSASKTGNNKILPTNSRAVDVAQKSVDQISHIQNKRYDNAFQVQGYEAILYSKKRGGLKCLCQTKNNTLGLGASILDADGNAKPGVLNELLTGGSFGVSPYGSKPVKPKAFEAIVTDIFGDSDPVISKPIYGAPGQGFARPGQEHANTKVVIDDGFADDGPVSGDGTIADEMFDRVLGSGFDSGFSMSSDIACPICFGTSFVGGFNVYNGHRLVLDSQVVDNTDAAIIDYEPFVPEITGALVKFKPVVLPRGAFGLDSFRVMNGSRVAPVKYFYVDNVVLANEQAVLKYFDGKPHAISVEFQETLDDDGNIVNCTFTHLEIQINQSHKPTKFEFPKLQQSSVETMIERTDSFQILMSPVVPNVVNGDIIRDSTYGKVFQVTSSNWWNDKRRAVLGWECDVRPCQPQELYSILPRRRPLQSQHNPGLVKANVNAAF